MSNRCRSQTDAAEMRELKAATTTIKMRFAFKKLFKKKKELLKKLWFLIKIIVNTNIEIELLFLFFLN